MAANVLDLPWHARLRKNENGKSIPDEANAMIAMRSAPELAGILQYNEFAMQCEMRKSPPWRPAARCDRWTDNDDLQLMVWLQHAGIGMRSRGSISECVSVIAHERTVHPVREYLIEQQWDLTPRLNTWLARYMGAMGGDEYLSAIGRRWMISAVARVMQPGCQADHTLVFEGIQGAGKSRTARALAVNPDWFADRIPDLHTADAAIQLAGRWIVELAELAAIRHTASIESSKAYLTRTFDVYRPPYGRRSISVPRQCVFIGSTNEASYLRDRTGNRRYWPVACGDIDIEMLERDRDQLWAEALVAYEAREPWHLDNDEQSLAVAEQDERVIVSELESEVANYLNRLEGGGIREVEVKQVLIHALNLEPDKSDYADKAGRLGPQVIGVMRSQGWEKVGVVGRGKTRRNIFRKNSQGSLLTPCDPL
jgi:putative DNA primase/helicase